MEKTATPPKESIDLPRRRAIKSAGAAMAAATAAAFAPAYAKGGKNMNGPASKLAVDITKPIPAKAWAAPDVGKPLAPWDIVRRPVGAHDVLLDVLYCGICHSDIHTVNNDWEKTQGKPPYPIVPGHEIIGRVIAVGKKVTKFRVGDIGGVGCMVDSCGTCANCLADREQVCTGNGKIPRTTFTYGSTDFISGGYTHGGYSDKLVVTEKFVIRIPPGMDLARTAPLLCAGITTFSPIVHWQVKPGQKVGVVGLGGLGHMAVKLAAAKGAEVTIFTTTPGKLKDAKKLGAKEAVLWSDHDAFRRLAGSFDFLVSTVPQSYPMQPFIDLLKLDATLCNVGALAMLDNTAISGTALAFGRKSLAGSMIGGIAETQETIDFCAARNIGADIELVGVNDINRAYQRVIDKDVRYRFVIDMASLKS
jgi:uncharacterized zinc-type alcohol dehydrogenase-like protein